MIYNKLLAIEDSKKTEQEKKVEYKKVLIEQYKKIQKQGKTIIKNAEKEIKKFAKFGGDELKRMNEMYDIILDIMNSEIKAYQKIVNDANLFPLLQKTEDLSNLVKNSSISVNSSKVTCGEHNNKPSIKKVKEIDALRKINESMVMVC